MTIETSDATVRALRELLRVDYQSRPGDSKRQNRSTDGFFVRDDLFRTPVSRHLEHVGAVTAQTCLVGRLLRPFRPLLLFHRFLYAWWGRLRLADL
jgi:hypothetical protein